MAKIIECKQCGVEHREDWLHRCKPNEKRAYERGHERGFEQGRRYERKQRDV